MISELPNGGPPSRETVIVKVQVPVVTNTKPLALVYNQARDYEIHLEIDAHLRKRMGKSFKKFFEAVITPDGIHLGPEVPDPGW